MQEVVLAARLVPAGPVLPLVLGPALDREVTGTQEGYIM